MAKKIRIEKTITNQNEASVSALRYGTNFAPLRNVQKELKERNLPWWPDLIREAMAGGDLLQLYIERYAKQWCVDLSDIEEKNRLKRKFKCISDAAWKYHFPLQFTIETKEGFEINKEAVREHFEQKYSVTLSDEQREAITSICEALELLNISPNSVGFYLYLKDGKVIPRESGFVKKFKK
jgi:hypothetical protein